MNYILVIFKLNFIRVHILLNSTKAIFSELFKKYLSNNLGLEIFRFVGEIKNKRKQTKPKNESMYKFNRHKQKNPTIMADAEGLKTFSRSFRTLKSVRVKESLSEF